jgi:hypothetical protein
VAVLVSVSCHVDEYVHISILANRITFLNLWVVISSVVFAVIHRLFHKVRNVSRLV